VSDGAVVTALGQGMAECDLGDPAQLLVPRIHVRAVENAAVERRLADHDVVVHDGAAVGPCLAMGDDCQFPTVESAASELAHDVVDHLGQLVAAQLLVGRDRDVPDAVFPAVASSRALGPVHHVQIAFDDFHDLVVGRAGHVPNEVATPANPDACPLEVHFASTFSAWRTSFATSANWSRSGSS
jgi:hypothetical protein